MVRQLFPLVHPDKLDVRTMELRDYLGDPKELNQEVQTLQLASAEVLDGASLDFKLGSRKKQAPTTTENAAATVDYSIDQERAVRMGEVANKLRIAGRLNEAREAFRRAFMVIPGDGRLMFEFARLLRSQAISLSDAKLLSRARAALRLAGLRVANDPVMLAIVGESFLEWGEAPRAHRSFQKVMDLDPANFRAQLGLATLALRDGKLAHVIHQYRDAARSATEKSLIAYARREGDYYARLNDDEDYLSAELRRINWLQHSLRVRRLAARVTNASILAALLVPYFNSAAAGLCWALATSSLFAWISSLLAIKVLNARRTPRLVD
jgi:predicted Zn-dependent protease